MKRWLGAMLAAAAAAVCLIPAFTAEKGISDSFRTEKREAAAARPAASEGTVLINEAEAEELLLLPGVGETLAQAILDERSLHGPFYYPEDLMSVRGIGPAKLEKMKPLLDFSEGE